MRKLLYILVFSALIISCIYPFETDIKGGTGGTLVIDGDIICGGYSEFNITRSNPIDKDTTIMIYLQKVSVEDEEGITYDGVINISSSSSVSSSAYSSSFTAKVDTRSIDNSKKYRLHLIADYKNYYTDYMAVEITPPIDSITYKVSYDSSAVSIQANTHNINEGTGYYKWTYQEDWEFRAKYFADYEYSYYSNLISSIDVKDFNRYYCWCTNASSNIVLAGTSSLSENRVSGKELLSIDRGNNRVNYLYCITVTQKSISKEGYDYWESLRKNNNDIGGIFSPQPSELWGNLTCVEDTTIKVLGYVSCCTAETARKFISNDDLNIYKNEQLCDQREYNSYTDWQQAYLSGKDIITVDEGSIIWANKECVDCRVYGTKNKPSWWPTDHK